MRRTGKVGEETAQEPADRSARRSHQTAESIGTSIQGKLTETSTRLKDNMKRQVVTAAIVGMLEDFEKGDFGDAGDMFDLLNDGINAPLETQCRVLEAWEHYPKYVLPEATISSSESGLQ
ncbi:MAG: hypothetical protein V7L23_29995 [Nostoc sp.]|uniref:hypothetical protein n=1 Tax=Nostoc sp. TaxID=1180 RepID=UPI002FF1764D